MSISFHVMSSLIVDSASSPMRSIQRFILGQRTPSFSISTSSSRSLFNCSFAFISSIVPSCRSYHRRSYLKYKLSNAKDIVRYSLSFFRKGMCGIASCKSCPTPIITAHSVVCCFQSAQVATLDAAVIARPKDRRRPYKLANLEHSHVYKALNLMLFRLFQSRVLIGDEIA